MTATQLAQTSLPEAAGDAGDAAAQLPATAPPRACPNCQAEAPGNFCPLCGQRQGELLVPIGSYIRGVAGDLLDLDGRFARTLRTLLFQPGALTRAWIEGRRASFTPPVRLFLLSSALAFGLTAALTQETPPFLAQAVFLLVPYVALLLKVLVRPRLPFSVHMVWALHTQSALFLVVALAQPVRVLPILKWPLAIGFAVAGPVYLLKAIARTYRHSLLRSAAVMVLVAAGWFAAYSAMFLVAIWLEP